MAIFKGTFKDFDFGDILQAYGKKFVPWMNEKTRLIQPQEETPKDDGRPRGWDALVLYFTESAKEGKDLTKGGIYQYDWGEMTKKVRDLADSLMLQYKEARTTF